jgi:hypothetical protein
VVHASGGSIGSLAVATGTETDIATWTLTAASINAMSGRYVKFIIGFLEDYPYFENFRYRIKLLSGTEVIWQSSQVQIDTGVSMAIRDLLTFALPPGLAGLTNLATIDLTLTGYQETGANVNSWIDWVQLTPVDGFAFVRTKGIATNNRIVLDGINDVYYSDTPASSNTTLSYVYKTSIPIMLQPGRVQRLYFLQHTDFADEYYTWQKLGVKVFYRPRRLSI